MNEAHPRRGQRRLAFFGRIGADISHEMRNVLSVIGEYAGLLDDLLVLAETGRPLDHARLKTLTKNLAAQVKKGTETTERFNRFSHTAEEQTASFDLIAVVEDVAALVQRHVRLEGHRLEVELPNREIRVTNNAFDLQYAVFAAVGILLKCLEKDEPVAVKVDAEGSTAALSISGRAAAGDEPGGRTSRLVAVMNELGGTVNTSWNDGTLSLVLAVPTD
ncbi:MAG: HAMP domain-containing histidine kinase [Pirellulales bacterium]|nr:HAMP domain-containing histidine kinase [Pirellulales bacterium]